MSVSVLFLLSLVAVACGTRITDFGAVPGDASVATARANSIALERTMLAANSTDKVFEVPRGLNFTYFNATFRNIVGVRLQLDGYLLISDNITESNWMPVVGASLDFYSCHDIEITGPTGGIDGQGYKFWWEVLLTGKDYRPHMIQMQQTSNIYIHDSQFFNSPQFHFNLRDCLNIHVKNIGIFVDVEQQKNMLQHHGHWHYGIEIPTFPLNTDGIDPGANNVLIENVTIQNFDDAVAVKPLNGHDSLSNCSQNMIIRNSVVYYGVGMTIGSVPPHDGVNCVRNITFENIDFHHAIKAIYVKTNPGNHGTGIIDNITYRNITGRNSLWYPIWIGPQQQQQPDTKGTGCSFFYPINPACPTQPRVPVTNIKLHDINFSGGVTLPGVLLCNETRPCTDFEFKNVVNNGEFVVQKDYVCKNVLGTVINSQPEPPCF